VVAGAAKAGGAGLSASSGLAAALFDALQTISRSERFPLGVEIRVTAGIVLARSSSITRPIAHSYDEHWKIIRPRGRTCAGNRENSAWNRVGR